MNGTSLFHLHSTFILHSTFYILQYVRPSGPRKGLKVSHHPGSVTATSCVWGGGGGGDTGSYPRYNDTRNLFLGLLF